MAKKQKRIKRHIKQTQHGEQLDTPVANEKATESQEAATAEVTASTDSRRATDGAPEEQRGHPQTLGPLILQSVLLDYTALREPNPLQEGTGENDIATTQNLKEKAPWTSNQFLDKAKELRRRLLRWHESLPFDVGVDIQHNGQKVRIVPWDDYLATRRETFRSRLDAGHGMPISVLENPYVPGLVGSIDSGGSYNADQTEYLLRDFREHLTGAPTLELLRTAFERVLDASVFCVQPWGISKGCTIEVGEIVPGKTLWVVSGLKIDHQLVNDFVEAVEIPFEADQSPPRTKSERKQGAWAKGSEPSTVVSSHDDRDKWIYDLAIKGTAWGTISNRLAKKTKWEALTARGVKDAANRYAKRHGLPVPPPRKAGRPARRNRK